jgi:hypothetical protein
MPRVLYYATQLPVFRRFDMINLENIKFAAERNRKAVELKPSLARGTEIARAQLREDMHFDIDVDGVKITAEVPMKYGGNGTTPGSSAHAISSLICCLLVGYLIEFAKRDIPISGLGIEVQADSDSAVKHEYTDVRYIVTVESDAPEEEIQRAIEDNDATSFGLAVFQQPVNARREVRVTAVAN